MRLGLGFESSPPPPPPRYHILASHHDLLLVRRCSGGFYYICNPLTKQWISLPCCPPAFFEHPWSPSSYTNVLTGFMYDHDHDHFKVVRLVKRRSDSSTIMLVFCSRTNQWSESRVSEPVKYERIHTFSLNSVVCNGLMHWLAQFNVNLLVSYQTDQLYLTELPTEAEGDFNGFPCISLGECQGSLRLVHLVGNSRCNRILRVWNHERNLNAVEWILKHEVRMDMIIADSNISTILLDPNDEAVVYFIIFLDQHTQLVLSFNMRSKELGEVWTAANPKTDRRVQSVIQLVLPWWPRAIPPTNVVAH